MPSLQLPSAHRYLWAQGALSTPLERGTVLAGRYQVLEFPLLLDTAPDAPPTPLAAVPAIAEPYLALSRFPTAMPRPFTQVTVPETGEPLLLLEEIPVSPQARTSVTLPSLMPAFTAAWAEAPALRQLGWLWQIARLWTPCVNHQVAGSLLDDETLRVEAEDIRLLWLRQAARSPTLRDLGEYWQALVSTADKPIRAYLTRLTNQLAAGKGTAAGLVASLTQALEQLAETSAIAVETVTYSDQGPTRQRNEDACYPPSGYTGQVTVAAATVKQQAAPFVVVCDGIGGHQGGDVASKIAIDEVKPRLEAIARQPSLPHPEIVRTMQETILSANQAIAQQNDAAQRHDRDRMGTTLVMALVYGARLYVAHLGDSRAYRVRSHNCRQITLDDDVAAREMRLGLGLYQDALQAPGSGTLVQALGMADARYLHPAVDVYPLTEQSVFLLCSDGLSDYGLLDRLWMTELQPVVIGDRDVTVAGKRLIDLANTHNGHDNVTVALLRVTPTGRDKPPALSIDSVALLTTTPSPPTQAPATPAAPRSAPDLAPTELVAPQRRSLPLVLTSLIMLALIGGGGALLWQRFGREIAGSRSPADPVGGTLSPTATPPAPATEVTPGDLSVGDFLQIQQLPDGDTSATLITTDSPPSADAPAAIDPPKRQLPVGSIVQVVSRQQTPNDLLWVRLEVCTMATTAEPPSEAEDTSSPVAADTPNASGDRPLPLAAPGDSGWLLETALPEFARRVLDTTPAQQGLCTD